MRVWKVCPICKEEFRTTTAKYCFECSKKAYERGYLIREIDKKYIMFFGNKSDKDTKL